MKININKKYVIILSLILLIIVGLVVLNTTGVLKKIGKTKEQIAEAEAKEKLEQALQSASTQKETDANYNSSEYLDALLQEQNIIVIENIVAIDGYNFEIDRENLQVTKSLGKSEVTVNSELVEVLGKNDNGKYRAKVQITVTSNIPIDNIIFQNENGTYSKEITEELTYTKEIEIELDKEYVVTIVTKDGKLSTNKIAQSSKEITIVEPGSSHTAVALTYSWEELEKVAKVISDNDSLISNDTAEVQVTVGGLTYTVGVGDTSTAMYNTRERKVRIIGFNHDKLTDTAAYGSTNTYAGISFEFAESIESALMNVGSNNYNGWGGCELRENLNSADINNVSNSDYIKQVDKTYLLGNKSTITQISQDKLWLLSCSEIWDNGYTSGAAYGFAKAKEGEQYKYYKQIDATSSSSNSKLNRGESWWLRSPVYNSSGSFCFVKANGSASGNSSYQSYWVAPGFSI